MHRDKVVSSNIASIGYDAETMTLEVEFNNGQVWQYEGVPASLYYASRGAPSIGMWFAANIRREYAGKRVN